MDAMIEAGYHTNDRLVQFPFWDDYKAELKSTIADITNLGGPYAGMITAGKFLEHFTSNIDMSANFEMLKQVTVHMKILTKNYKKVKYNQNNLLII